MTVSYVIVVLSQDISCESSYKAVNITLMSKLIIIITNEISAKNTFLLRLYV